MSSEAAASSPQTDSSESLPGFLFTCLVLSYDSSQLIFNYPEVTRSVQRVV